MAIQLMSNALPSPKQEKRIEALYVFYGESQEEVVKEAARSCARELDKFPTPAVFGQFVSRASAGKTYEGRAICSKCDGYGWAFHEGAHLRGRCGHGALLSSSIPLAPESWSRTPYKRMEEKDLREEVSKDPELYAKGILYTQSIGIPRGEPMVRLEKIVRSVLGENRYREIGAKIGVTVPTAKAPF